MRVRDAMTRDVVVVGSQAPVGDLVALLAERRVSGCPVVDDGRLVGVVSESDVLKHLRTHLTRQTEFLLPTPFDLLEYPLRAALQRQELENTIAATRELTVERIMTRRVHVAEPDEDLADASARMLAEGVNRLPVVEGDAVVGILTRGDVVRALARQGARRDQAREAR